MSDDVRMVFVSVAYKRPLNHGDAGAAQISCFGILLLLVCCLRLYLYGLNKRVAIRD